MFTHVITRKWQSGAASLSKSEEIQADGETNRDANLAISVVDHPITFALKFAFLQSIYILCGKDCTLTPYDESDSPMAPIDLRADVPFEWTVGSGLDNPFAADVGSLKATNLSAVATTLKIRCLHDTTESNAVAS